MDHQVSFPKWPMGQMVKGAHFSEGYAGLAGQVYCQVSFAEWPDEQMVGGAYFSEWYAGL